MQLFREEKSGFAYAPPVHGRFEGMRAVLELAFRTVLARPSVLKHLRTEAEMARMIGNSVRV